MSALLLRAYGTIPEFLKSITGWQWIPNIPINTYGTFVALGFLSAAYIAFFGLRDRGNLGLLKGFTREDVEGSEPKISDLISPFIMWFIIGFKFIGALFNDPGILAQGQKSVAFILSLEGFWFWGLIGGFAGAGYQYYNLKKQQLPTPKKIKVEVKPEDLIGELVGVAALFGVVGASVFEIIQPNSDMTLKQL